jgi:hypothetical protein
MKEIQPVSIWYNGQVNNAIIYNMYSINDDLSTQCTFCYQLYDANNLQLAQGNITMYNADYTTYSTSTDSNEYAYQWGATQLNLTLV